MFVSISVRIWHSIYRQKVVCELVRDHPNHPRVTSAPVGDLLEATVIHFSVLSPRLQKSIHKEPRAGGLAIWLSRRVLVGVYKALANLENKEPRLIQSAQDHWVATSK